MRGKISKRPYEVDVHARKEGFLVTQIYELNVKPYKIKRTHVTKLVESARDARDAAEASIEKWYPDMLMLVSNNGFDVDAIGMADKYCIYCVKAGKTFDFVGKMNRDDFENEETSEY